MSHTNFIVREPLLDPAQKVVGYQLSWQQRNAGEVDVAAIDALIAFVADEFNDEEKGYLLADSIIF